MYIGLYQLQTNTISRFLSHFVTSAGIHLESCKNKCFKVNDAMLRVLPNETSWPSFPYFCMHALLVAWFIFIFKNSILILSYIWDFIVAVSSKVIYWNFQYIRVYQNKKNKIILTIFKFIRIIGWYIHLKLIIYNIFTPFSNEHHSCRLHRFIKYFLHLWRFHYKQVNVWLWHTTPGWFQTVNLYYMVLLHFDVTNS